ncbi:MAG: hypothetical protein OXT73_07635 [Bacteroidota bacterium]|nr:hypothetical protein [Bacteroidota bacterium]
MQTAIFITALTSLATLVGWMFWAASKILREDRQRPVYAPRMSQSDRLLAGTKAVRFRDIRTREAERMATVPGDADYLYEEGYSVGWPDEWTDDLMLRRN